MWGGGGESWINKIQEYSGTSISRGPERCQNSDRPCPISSTFGPLYFSFAEQLGLGENSVDKSTCPPSNPCWITSINRKTRYNTSYNSQNCCKSIPRPISSHVASQTVRIPPIWPACTTRSDRPPSANLHNSPTENTIHRIFNKHLPSIICSSHILNQHIYFTPRLSRQCSAE